MTIATTLGNATGTSAAYAKHGVLMTGIGGIAAVQEYIVATRESYALKDAELAARREEFKRLAKLPTLRSRSTPSGWPRPDR